LESDLGAITIKDIGEALYLRAGDLSGSTVIIVATLQAFWWKIRTAARCTKARERWTIISKACRKRF
jgi:hypothetical protein